MLKQSGKKKKKRKKAWAWNIQLKMNNMYIKYVSELVLKNENGRDFINRKNMMVYILNTIQKQIVIVMGNSREMLELVAG